jgi:hypothetical protein
LSFRKQGLFFEEKKQKTFIRLASAFPDELSLRGKSSLVLFSKKEPLPCSRNAVPERRHG